MDSSLFPFLVSQLSAHCSYQSRNNDANRMSEDCRLYLASLRKDDTGHHKKDRGDRASKQHRSTASLSFLLQRSADGSRKQAAKDDSRLSLFYAEHTLLDQSRFDAQKQHKACCRRSRNAPKCTE